jgi:ubiquitin-protein ligase
MGIYQKMINNMITNTPFGWTLVCMNDNMTAFHFTLIGAEPPYDNRVFNVHITYTDEQKQAYPFCSLLPSIHFTDPVFHCNIDANGFMRVIDDLSPIFRLNHFMMNILVILSNPDPHCVTNEMASAIYFSDKIRYDMLARGTH